MNLDEIVNLVALPVAFTVGINIQTYDDTKNWLASHKIDNSWHKEEYKKFKESSKRGYVVYYLGFPGRKIAYMVHNKNLDMDDK